ncbi:TonB family protein [Candidatus Accumulibacter sp. ACC003]|uniref:energy transducer TonB n=1 Tax=Candidatus Accumulibacter sp. ACC003 TaxID=2823334 RepID=UPI0025C6B20C|nr:TonB family protein [Candidatus Accumulibacter sp. ACC003]
MVTLFFSDARLKDACLSPLAAALLASLVLHLLLLVALQFAAGSAAGERLAGSALQATLNASVGGEAPGESAAQTALPSALPGDEGDAVEAAAAAPAALDGVEDLGQRQLATSLPLDESAPLPLASPSESPTESQAESLTDSPLGQWYFPRSQLTRAAELRDEPPIVTPPNEAPASGKLVLRVLLGAGGAVDRIEVSRSSLPPAYDAAVVSAFTGLRFRPGEIDGMPVRSEARFEIAFDADEIGSSHAAGRSATAGRRAPLGVPPETGAAARKVVEGARPAARLPATR